MVTGILETLAAISPFFDCIDPSLIEADLFHVEEFSPDQVIFRKGDTGSKAYVVISGIIGLYEQVDHYGGTPFLKVARGKLFGTYAMLCGDARSATAIALTDTSLASIDRLAFHQLLDASPELCKRVLTSLAREASRGRTPQPGHQARCVLIRENLNDSEPSELHPLYSALAQLESLDLVDRRGSAWDQTMQLLDLTRHLEQERSVAFILDQDTPLSASTRRLIDANLLIIHGNDIGSQIPADPDEVIDLVRTWPADQDKPTPLATQPEQLNLRHVYNIRKDRPADALRVARCILGIGNAFVLGGGGTKGFAHVGAIKAMAELAITEIDWIYGVSIGSFVGMLYAFEMSWEAIEAYMKLIFVDGTPYSLSPSVHSLFRYSTSLEQLQADFGSFSIQDTWIPFRPASTNLTCNRLTVWTEGGVLQRVIASMSIPGILPPVQMEDGSIHVDGSAIDNLPIAEARRCTAGKIVAISLDHGEGQRVIPTLADSNNTLLQWLVSAGWANRSLPLLTDTIVYALLGASRQKSDDDEHLADVVLKPELLSVGLLDWNACDAALEAGYREAKQNSGALEAIRRGQRTPAEP